MISSLVVFLVDRLTDVLTYMVRAILWSSFAFSFAYSMGWVQRFLWFILEQTATKLWNDTPVTIGSLEIDLIRGRIWATNVVIHTPRREEWQWESPLICRIGRVYVEHNWISSFLTMVLKMACGQTQKQILEIYTLEVSDIQGFIERKQHIFNFYLMDPWMDLPDPKDVLKEEKKLGTEQEPKAENSQQQAQISSEPTQSNDYQTETSIDLSIHQDNVEAAFANTSKETLDSNNQSSSVAHSKEDHLVEEEDDAMAHRQAQQLVDEMFSAVKSIGRTKGGKGALDRGSIASHLASKLKQLKGTKNKTEVMQEGVKVVKVFSQAVAKKTKDMKTVMPKMPNRREPNIAPVFARVGRIIIQDGRVFTRTAVASNGKGVPEKRDTSHSPLRPRDTRGEGQLKGGQKSAKSSETDTAALSDRGLGSGWNKPIGISEIVLRPSELCPPNFLLDENGLPAIYQPLDKIVDVVLKRALVGLAKNNTARFLQTALAELLEMEYSSIFGDNGGTVRGDQPQYRRRGAATSEANV